MTGPGVHRPRTRLARLAVGLAAVLAAACAAPAAAPGIAPERLRSGLDSMGPSTRAMQQDDAANPGMLAVRQGEALWRTPAGRAQRACADCHGEAAASMRGAAARHPRWDARTGRPVDLSQRIAACRERHQQAPAGAPEGAERLALAAFVGHASRGLPVRPDDDPRLAPAREQGRALFAQRLGQLDLSCADCHDARWGARLGGSLIPQGHANGYPLYRLEWQALGSLQRRLRSCLAGVRAEPWPPDAPEYVALELHLQARGAGLPIETPAVRP
jgi:sulfur-oxidizing protein SoxA